MNNVEIFMIINQICMDKGIDKQTLFSALETALVSATRKAYQLKTADGIEAKVDETNKDIVVTINGERVPADELGRIAAQTARQVIIQKIREAEKDVVFREFQSLVGKLVSGTVYKIDRRQIIVDVGKAEGILPRREQSFRDNYRQGDRIKAILLSVTREPKGPILLLSRRHSDLVKQLFELEVPEIKDGIVVIKEIVREAGEHTKIAVASVNEKIDPMGACVGMRGTRIKNIVNELQGERIDVVRWSNDPVEFIKEALKPAKVEEVRILNTEKKHAEVLVDESQLSLAIGRRGQNVRLASKLTGWELDVRTAEGSQMTSEQASRSLEKMLLEVSDVDEEVVANLKEAGFYDLNSLAMASVDDLIEVEGVDKEIAENIIVKAKEYLAKGDEEE